MVRVISDFQFSYNSEVKSFWQSQQKKIAESLRQFLSAHHRDRKTIYFKKTAIDVFFLFFFGTCAESKNLRSFFSIFLSPPLRLFLFFPFSSISNILRFSAFLIHYPFLLFPFFPLNCMPLLLFKNVSIENNIRFSDRKINDKDI